MVKLCGYSSKAYECRNRIIVIRIVLIVISKFENVRYLNINLFYIVNQAGNMNNA